jgi:hypothetical protein
VVTKVTMFRHLLPAGANRFLQQSAVYSALHWPSRPVRLLPISKRILLGRSNTIRAYANPSRGPPDVADEHQERDADCQLDLAVFRLSGGVQISQGVATASSGGLKAQRSIAAAFGRLG